MPQSKRKRYLSGSDWVIGALDNMMKRRTSAGNMSQIALALSSKPDENEVRFRLNRFASQFPALQGTVSRDILLAPYWKIPARTKRELSVTVHHLDEADSIHSFLPRLELCANIPFRDKREHVAFHLIQGRNRSVLAMTFDHRIFDARGAESFLNLFHDHDNGAGVSGGIEFSSTAALTGWTGKFVAGRNVNRKMMSLSRCAPEALPLPVNGNGMCRYRLLSLNEQETSAVYEQAYREAGYLMESTYLLAVVIQAAHGLLSKKFTPATSYLVPVTMDLRPGSDQVQEIFFNYVSYLFYQVPVNEAGDRKQLTGLLKQQMYDQVKSGFPRDLAEASLLTRIAPLSVLGMLLHLPLKGKMATFAFSHLGKSSLQQPQFLGQRIETVFHTPRVPVPPGLGFFSNYYNNRLNLVISYIDGLLSEQDLDTIERGLLRGFGLRGA
jgi:hypothetical protein